MRREGKPTSQGVGLSRTTSDLKTGWRSRTKSEVMGGNGAPSVASWDRVVSGIFVSVSAFMQSGVNVMDVGEDMARI